MPISRHLFQLSTDTGSLGDTGINFMGAVEQVRWNPISGDTGANAVMTLGLLPRMGDTGDGWIFATYTNLAANFVRVPRQPTHDAQGAVDQTDTGTPASPAPVVSATDRLRVKVTGGPLSGRLYVWTRD